MKFNLNCILLIISRSVSASLFRYGSASGPRPASNLRGSNRQQPSTFSLGDHIARFLQSVSGGGENETSSSSNTTTASTPTVNYHVELSKVPLTEFPGGLFRQLQHELITNNTMDLAYVQLFPGGVRELHWHPQAAEWGFVVNGTCLITLMNNEGNYSNELAPEGSIWYFPVSWGHSIYGQDPDVGCTMILSFDYPQNPTFNDLSLSQMASYFPSDVVSENLGVPRDLVEESFPRQILIMNKGPPPPQEVAISRSPLPLSPVFRMDDGLCGEIGTGGYYFQVRQNLFPLASTMSGAYMHLEEGTMRDIHWHPNADELQYVLSGKVQVGIYGVGGVNDTYTLSEGDVGFVPKGFMHYFQALEGPVNMLLTFNSPSWATQLLSTWLSVTPSFIAAASLNTTVDVVDKYFPKSSQDFYGEKFVGCPAAGIPKTYQN